MGQWRPSATVPSCIGKKVGDLLSLNQLELFVAIANCGSMRIASERFYMSQSALSQNVKKLENELGCTLLDRSRSPLKPTAYGKIVLDRAERMLFLAQDIKEEIDRKKEQEAATLRIGCFYPMLAYSEMAHVANAHKEINFKATIASEESIADGLIRGNFDLALLPDRRAIPGFAKMELGREELYVSLPLDSPFQDRTTMPCDKLKDLEIVVPRDLEGVTPWYMDILSELNIDGENIVELSSEDYFSAMNDFSVTHFRSSLMTAPLASLSRKKHLPLTDPKVERTIIAMFPVSRSKELEPVIETLKEDQGRIVSSMGVLPKLLQISESTNLKITDAGFGSSLQLS